MIIDIIFAHDPVLKCLSGLQCTLDMIIFTQMHLSYGSCWARSIQSGPAERRPSSSTRRGPYCPRENVEFWNSRCMWPGLADVLLLNLLLWSGLQVYKNLPIPLSLTLCVSHSHSSCCSHSSLCLRYRSNQ